MENTLEIAKTIQQQIGNKALCMMGAKNIAGSNNSLSFKICGSKITHIKIKLNGLDLYDITFYTIRYCQIKSEEIVENVYAEDMHKLIETKTGLYLSL